MVNDYWVHWPMAGIQGEWKEPGIKNRMAQHQLCHSVNNLIMQVLTNQNY